MDTKLVEEIKNLLKDVENFLTQTLKSNSLNKDGISKKTQLVSSVQNVIQKLAGDDGETVQEMYDDVDVEKNEPIAEEDCDQLYEITDMDVVETDTVSKKSQDEKTEDGDDPYGYGGSGTKIEPIPAEKLINPAFSGNLEKKSKGLIKSWQTRYCIIKDNVFYYYKKKNSNEQQGTIVLNGYEARACPHLDNNKKKECNFELVCPTKRSYQFIASDSTVMNSWIEAVKKASTIPFPVTTGGTTPSQQGEDFDALYEDTAVAPEETYEDTEINTNEEAGDFDDVYELVESDYADARRKQEEAARNAVPSPAPIPVKLPAAPLPPKPSTTSEPAAQDFGDFYDDVDIQPSPKEPPSNKPLPKLPPQPLAPAQKKPLPSVPPIPSRSPINDSSTNVPSPTSPPASEQTNAVDTSEPWEDDYKNIYMSKWDCEGSDNELKLKRGELVHILSREYDSYGWWIGEKNFEVGLIPLDYLMKAYKI